MSDTDERVIRVPRGHDALRDAATGDTVAVHEVGPTGVGAVDPLITATAAGETAFYVDPGPDRVRSAAAALADGESAGSAGSPDAVVDGDGWTDALPRPDLQGLDRERHLLAGCGWRRPASPEDHDSAGGFVDADPDTVLDAAADLRGRGWGDWRRDEPVGPLWERVADSDTADPALVVNAHGTDRGTSADALLLASAPFEVLEGADAVARAVGASEVVVYVNEADEAAVETVREAIEAYPDPAAPMSVVTGPPVYRAAEPTMALEAIGGADRLEARLRRPDALPTLGRGRTRDGRPALVHTARTLGHLALSLRQNGDPTRLVTVAGDVESPATVELAEEEPLSAAVEAVEPAGEIDAACVGGRFGGLTDSLDVAADPDALADADLGTDGRVELLAADRCVLEFVGRRAQFAADANCGRCVPCREGATQLADLLRDVYDGDYDAAGVEELTRVMDGTSACDFGVDAARPARTAVARFDDTLAAHADGRCPAGSCFDGETSNDAAGDSTTAAAATDGGEPAPEVPR